MTGNKFMTASGEGSLIAGARRFGGVAFRGEIFWRAIRTSLFVGSLLVLINHGPEMFDGSLTFGRWLRIGLTYVVPYSVATYSATMYALRAGAGLAVSERRSEQATAVEEEVSTPATPPLTQEAPAWSQERM
jgi:hypothetical protein